MVLRRGTLPGLGGVARRSATEQRGHLMTLCLFRHFSKTNHPLTHLDGYLLEPG